MSNIILSSGIRGIDWQECLNVFAKVSHSIVHYDNIMSSTNGKFDEILVETTVPTAQLESTKKQFKHHLDSLSEGSKRSNGSKEKNSKPVLVNFCSDTVFIESGDAWHECNRDKKFLFFFCSPEYYLAKYTAKNLDKEEALNNWLEDTARIWNFYARYPENTSVISIEDVETDSKASLSQILSSLDVKSVGFRKTSTSVTEAETDIEKLSLLISQNLCLTELKNKREIQDLYADLAMVSVMADDNLIYLENDRVQQRLLSCQDLCSQLIGNVSEFETDIIEQAAINLKLESRVAELVSSNSQFKLALQECEIRINEQARGNQDHKKQTDQLKAQNNILNARMTSSKSNLYELELNNVNLKNSNSELTLETKRLLLQISLQQQEIELVAIKINERDTIRAKLENDNIVIENDKLELKSECSNLAEKLAQSEAHIAEIIIENKLSSIQFEQLQEELNAADIQLKKFDALNTNLEISRSELSLENELNSLQMDQLQEELQDNFIEFQNMTYSPNSLNSYQGDLKQLKSSLSLMRLQ